jgi:enoyl-CoA hydratase
MRGFADAVERAQEAPDLRALVVTGAGTAFISGGDLAELGDYPSRADGLRLATLMGDALSRLEALPCPTIAAINGPPRGGGAEVAVACDQRIMAEDADIGFVHIRLGLITAWGGGQRLLRTVGYSTAIELMTKGRVLSAREALSLRLTDRVAPMGQALLAARDLAGQVAENPPPAVRAAKRVLRVSLVADEGMAMEAERNEFPDLWDTDWRREAVAHFLSRSR